MNRALLSYLQQFFELFVSQIPFYDDILFNVIDLCIRFIALPAILSMRFKMSQFHINIFHRPLFAIRIHLQCEDRKSTRLNSSHVAISYAVFCLKKKKKKLDE